MKLPIRNDQLRLLFELDSDLNRIQDLDFLLEEILRGARLTVNADAGSIYLVEGGQLHFRYSQNDTLQRKLPHGEKLVYNIFSMDIDNRSIAGYCALTGQMLNIPDVYKIPKKSPYSFNPQYDRLSHYETHSMLTLPLKTNTDSIIGVLQLINTFDSRGVIRPFNKSDERLVFHFASSATMALQRAQLTRTMILRMTRLAALWDVTETGAHVNRVAGYSSELYRRWAVRHGMETKEIDRTSDAFRMAAMLHDVGKVGIDGSIMKKKGKLDADEYEIMKTHTTIGEGLFQDPLSEFEGLAAQVCATHHERWDGNGYPRKLAGNKIPLWGRITAVADVYDALSCHRVYKAAWTQEEVLAEMRAQSGKQFDPEIIDLLFEALPNLKQIFERYPDV